MPEVTIALGANAGQPEAQVREAFERLKQLSVGGFRASSLWHSEPEAMNDDSGMFVNAVVCLETDLSPKELLSALQQIEVDMGRPGNHGKNVARTMDLDIIVYGAETITEPALVIPHPRLTERLFVLLPLREVSPNFELGGQSIAQLIAAAPSLVIQRC